MGKRGQIGEQFNWIFVIIAGALILTFFVMVVQKQRALSEKKLAAELLADLDMIVTGQAVSPGTTRLLEMSELEISFTCEDYSISNVPKTSGNSIIFSPSRIKGSSLIAWTLEWDMPYRAANFIYLTVPEIKYYLIGAGLGSDGMGIKADFPEKMDLEIAEETPDEFEDSQRVRLVYFAKPQGDEGEELPLPSDGLKKFKDEQVSVLYIDAAKADDFNGKADLYFYKKEGDSIINEGFIPGTLGKEIVYGAIFSDSYELYMCNIQKALKKLDVVTEVYKERTRYLLEGLPAGDPCSPYYSTESLQNIIDTLNADVINVGNIFTYMKQIQNMNDLTIFASCPEIY